MDERLQAALAHARRESGLIVVLTGAGISAESGIPTFRGKDGYWTVVGTSASTTLPWHVVEIASRKGAAIVDLNIEHNPFARIAEAVDVGCAVRGQAAEHVPAMVERLLAVS